MRVGDQISEHAAWSYPQLLPEGPQTQGYLAFYWDLMDAWFEEEQRVYAHARNLYKRVDILPSSRHLRNVLVGVTIADTHRPLLLLETELPIRYYLPLQDMRVEFLMPTETITYCPYKGMARYWSASMGGQVFKDIVWSYQEPLTACTPIAHFLRL